ncbi:MAG: substrate-binding domain-containing protein [Candidatus Jordarchaeaceae archaeon]
MSGKKVLNVYSCCDVATPLKISGKRFQDLCGSEIKFTIGMADELFPKLTSRRECDIFTCGAAYLMDEVEKNGLVTRESRKVLGYRRSVILTQKGNPKKLKSLIDLTKKDVKIAVSTTESLKGVWDEITSKTGLTEKIQKNITLYADGCGELIGSLVQKRVDAAFGWNTYKVLHTKAIDAVELPKEIQIYRSTIIATTKFTENKETANKFIEFLTSKEGRETYQKYGWILPNKSSK